MHRSGTSLIANLLLNMDMHIGGPVIGSLTYNHCERIDVVLQNDEILDAQGLIYDSPDVYKFDYLSALKLVFDAIDFGTHFFEGRRALRFYNERTNTPWLLKDPRMCITLRVWLPLFNYLPAAVLIYRDPMSVALSMIAREPSKYTSVQLVLQLWYVYNMRAIQQSADLCRVIISYKEILLHPEASTARVHSQLTFCGVHNLRPLTTDDVMNVVFPGAFQDFDCGLVPSSPDNDTMVVSYDLNSITLPEEWQWVSGRSPSDDLRLFRAVMQLYCAMESGEAFSPDYAFDLSVVIVQTNDLS